MHYERRIHLAARVCDLHAAYVHCLDRGAFEEWPAFFTERCRYKVTTAENHRAGLPAGLIDCDSRAMLVDRVQSLRHANIYESHSYRHVVAPPQIITELPASEIEASTGFIVVRTMQDAEPRLFASGEYLDRLRFANDASMPLIVERIVVLDSSRIDTLLVLPL